MVRKALAPALAMILFVSGAWADRPEAEGFDQALYEGSFLEAERAVGAEAWLSAARAGAARSVARWEGAAAALYEDAGSLAAAKAGLADWVEDDLAQRFGEWLSRRFFGRAASRLKPSAQRGVGRANAAFLYVIDDRGGVEYDEAGNPEYRRSAEGLAEDEAAWRSVAEAAAEAALGEYAGWLERMRPELLAYVPEGERHRYEAAIAKAAVAARLKAGAELDRLLSREEGLFVARRTADVWSLRRKSDSDAADSIAANLAREAASECDEGIAALSARIEAAKAMSGEDAVASAGEEWLAAFEESFRRGLESWRQAEERFMVRRLEWERDAGRAYQGGNEAWAKAYESLEAEYRAWEAKAGSLLREGEAAFERASEALEAGIASAKAEFEAGAAGRSEASAERAEAWVGVYLEAGSAAASVRDGLGYWLSLLGEEAPSANSPGLAAWLEAESAEAGASPSRLGAIAEARSSLGLYEEYSAKAEEARARLVELSALELGDGDRSLVAVLAPGARSEDFHLDEYQVALLRARAVEGYWLRRVSIARAVLDYARDLSSGRATEGEQLARLASTQAAYEAAVEDYRAAASALASAGEAIGSASARLNEARSALSAAQAALSGLQDEYALLMGELAADDDGAFVGEALYERYRSLVDASGFGSAAGAPSEAALTAAYLEAAGRLGYARGLERSGEALRLAVQGGGGEPSLAALAAAAASVVVPTDTGSGAMAVEAYGISEGDTALAAVASLGAAMEAELSGAVCAEEAAAIKARYGALAAAAAEGAKARAEAALASRLAGISLLGAEDAASWLASQAVPGLGPEADIEEALASYARAKRLALLRARAALELEAVSVARGALIPDEASEAAVLLSSLGALDPGRAAQAAATLAALLAAIDAGIGDAEAGRPDAFADLCSAEPDAAAFLRGQGFFALAGLDSGGALLTREYAEMESAAALSEAYARWGAYASALDGQRLARALSALSGRLAELGLAYDEALPSSRAVGAAILGRADPGSAIARLIDGVDQAASLSPEWVAEELEAWKSAIVDYAAAKSAAEGKEAPEAAASLADQARARRERAAALGQAMSGLSEPGGDYVRALVSAASIPAWTASESALIFGETSALIAQELAEGFGAVPGEPDWAAAEASLSDSARVRYGFAGDALLGRAVGLAVGALREADAKARGLGEGPDADREARLLAIAAAARRYAGSYSGGAVSWARTAFEGTAYEGDEAMALALARRLEEGSLDDGMSDLSAEGVDRLSQTDPFRRWLYEAASAAADAGAALARELYGRSRYSAAYEAAVGLAREASSRGERHWRQALASAGLSRAVDSSAYGDGPAPPREAGDPEADIEGTPKKASSWAEGALADAYEEAERCAARVGAALGVWAASAAELSLAGSEINAAQAAFRRKAEAYLAAPLKVFDPGDVSYSGAALADASRSKREEYMALDARRREARGAIVVLAAAYDIASDEASIRSRLDEIEGDLREAREGEASALAAYSSAALAFRSAGEAYDAAYGSAKAMYEGAEAARTAFETEDAIRRWASTAYLAAEGDEADTPYTAASYRSPASESAFAESSLERARAALDALEGLYGDGQTERPYADARYRAAVEEYRDLYRRMLLASKARDAVAGALAGEYRANDAAYTAYLAALYGDGTRGAVASAISYKGFEPAAAIESAEWKDALSLRGGTLALSYGPDFRLSLGGDSESLVEYFGSAAVEEGAAHPSTRYERDARAWAGRVSEYLGKNGRGFESWAKARDYLLSRLAEANPECGLFAGAVKRADGLQGSLGGMAYEGSTLGEGLDAFRASTLEAERKAAWDGLSEQQRADLEFYIAMTMTGGASESRDAFRVAGEAAEYDYVKGEMERFIGAKRGEAKSLAAIGSIFFSLGLALSWVPPASVVYIGMATGMFVLSDLAAGKAEEWTVAMTSYLDPALAEARTLLASGQASLAAEADGVGAAYAAYAESCSRLAGLEGEAAPGADHERAFRASLSGAGLADSEIDELMEAYAEFRAAEPGREFIGAAEALGDLIRWSKNGRDDALAEVERGYEAAAARAADSEDAYLAVYERYLSGYASRSELAEAARAAYGPESASTKAHLAELGGAIEDAVFGLSAADLSEGSAEGAWRYASIVGRAAEARFAAELAAREAEWDALRRGLADKRTAWREAGGLILSRGRADFSRGFETLRERGAAWLARFAGEYGAKAAAWDRQYAALLEDKLSWAARTTDAANEAGSEAMLAMVGSDAAAGARLADTRSASTLELGDGAAEAYAEAIGRSGIIGMLSALGSQAKSASTAACAAWAGVGGAAAWDSGGIRAAAAEFARTAERNLAGAQARALASRAREAAEAAVAGLAESVRLANDGFGRSMDEAFVGSGKWRREGDSYVKDVVTHSTAADPYITERASVAAYDSFELGDWELTTDLSDAGLRGLADGAIVALVRKAQAEVKAKGEAVFGKDGETGPSVAIEYYKDVRVEGRRIATKRGPDGDEYEVEELYYRTVSELDEGRTVTETEGAGAFGRHVGYAAHLSDAPDPSDLSTMFQGEAGRGSGELGRLLREYLYWAVKEGAGWAEANKPLYEKDLWDDRGSWFKAPSVRGIVDIGVSAAAGLLTGGLGAIALNLADDALFEALDVSGGYDSWQEAGLQLGKGALASMAGAAGGALFGGAMETAERMSGVAGLVGRAALGGVRSYATGLAYGAIGSLEFEYDGSGNIAGLGFDEAAFTERAFGEGAIASYAGAMAGAALGSSAGYGGAFERKLWGGLASLGAMAATEGAQYLTHVAYSAARGTNGADVFGDAWARDGIVLNVANLGTLAEAAGFLAGLGGSGYDAMEREGIARLADALGAAGLDLSIGAHGVSGSLGSSGYDLIGIGMSIGQGLVLDRKLDGYAAAHGAKAAEALRTAYGYGDFAAEESVWRLALGKDRLLIADGAAKAETAVDSQGRRIIRVSSEGDSDESMLDLAVALQHEAWRDGWDGGLAGQGAETYRAALAHTRMAAALSRDGEYGAAMLRLVGSDSDYRSDLASYADGGFEAYAGMAYDSSGDYWKLTKDGELLNDGRARLLVEIVDDDGTQGWRLVEGSDAERSVSAALVRYLGEDRALELLGGSLANASRYDDQTLHDVLNLDDVDIRTMRNNPSEAERVIMSATAEQRQKLLGEALMKRAGITWDGSAWLGAGGGISLSDDSLHGSAAIRSIGSGLYERYSITSELERYEGAYDAWKDGVKGDLGEGNTRIAFTKWDIDSGEQLATIVAGGAWNSVDNSYGQLDINKNPIGTDKQYQILGGPTLQGNTIAAGSMNLRWAQDGSKPEWGDVFILSDTRTIAGETIGVDGRRTGRLGEDRWLMHFTDFGSSDGCFVYKKGEDTFDQLKALFDSLKTWGLYQGYPIAGSLSDYNSYPYRLGYRKGSW